MKSFPFDSHVTYDSSGAPSYDRAISSDPYRKLIKELFTTGIMPTSSANMQVVAGENMTVTVKAGFAVVEGCMSLEEDDRSLEITASNTQDRIDTVVLRLNTNDEYRTCDYYVVAGTPASSPVHPDLTRTNSIYEIGLADVFVPANSTAVSDERITDTRYDTERCGVISSISEFDTSTLNSQMNAWSAEKRTEFESWVASLKDILDEETAGHLQTEISALQEKIDGLELTAEKVSYDNTTSGLEATNVQEAIDDLNTHLAEKLKGTIIGCSADHMVIQIDKGILICGYTLKSYLAWEGIFDIDFVHYPSVNVQNGSFQLTTDGLFRVVSNVSAGTAYFIYYTI